MSYGIVLAKDVMVQTRDGIGLATDVYRPAREGEPVEGERFPTILCRTPYDKTDKRYTEIADFFVPRGYAVALQDCRDRYRSEGTGDYFHTVTKQQGQDGYDTVEWIAEQRWSNGRVGTVGSSYAAITQVRMALERPPHLTAIWPDVVPTNSFQHQSREGGAMQMHMFWALFIHAQDAQDIADDWDKQAEVWGDLTRLRELFWGFPFGQGELALRHTPTLEQALLDYTTRGVYDEYWAQESNDFTAHFARHADIPGTFSTGWYDGFPHSDTEYFAAMAEQNEAPQRLIVGPWSHVGMRGDATWTLDVDFGADSVWGVERYFQEQLAFFDRWLKEDGGGAPADEAPIRIFVMGGGSGRKTELGKLDHGGRWREEHEWPLARAQEQLLYLHGDGSLSKQPPEGEAEPRRYTYDPEDPVPTIGGNYCSVGELPADGPGMEPMWARLLNPVLRLRNILTPGPADQRESAEYVFAREPYGRLRDRADVLVYETEPLAEDVEVTGRATVNLWISSSALDTDFTAKLVDVYPPNEDYPEGYEMLLNDSIIRTRFREGFDREVLLEPGEIVPVSILLPPTSNLFAKGHRIRVDVSSSNFPRLDRNPNTGEPIGRHTQDGEGGAGGLCGRRAPVARLAARRPRVSELDFVPVPAGPFAFGDDPARLYPPEEDETPRRVVHVDAFRISRLPVCDDDGVPLTYVSRVDAEAFAAAKGARLPTELEWEAAARGGDERLWPWGDELPDATRATFAAGHRRAIAGRAASGGSRALRRARPGRQRLRVDGRRRRSGRLVSERPGRAALLGPLPGASRGARSLRRLSRRRGRAGAELRLGRRPGRRLRDRPRRGGDATAARRGGRVRADADPGHERTVRALRRRERCSRAAALASSGRPPRHLRRLARGVGVLRLGRGPVAHGGGVGEGRARHGRPHVPVGRRRGRGPRRRRTWHEARHDGVGRLPSRRRQSLRPGGHGRKRLGVDVDRVPAGGARPAGRLVREPGPRLGALHDAQPQPAGAPAGAHRLPGRKGGSLDRHLPALAQRSRPGS